jgi:hypothetical protein
MTRGRKPNPPKPVTELTPEGEAAFENDFRVAQGQLMEANMLDAEAFDHANALAARVGYELPAGELDAELITRDIAVNMRRSVDSVLNMGRGLLVLKSLCGHGDFQQRIGRLGIEPRLAQRLMQSALKFSNASTSTHLLPKIDSQSKLFEFLVLDDEDIKELTETGQFGNVKLDEVDTMSVQEMRAALREAIADKKAAERVSADSHRRADEAVAEMEKLKASKTGDESVPEKPDRSAQFDAAWEDIHNFSKEAISVIDSLKGALRKFYELSPGPSDEPDMRNVACAFVEKVDDANQSLQDAFAHLKTVNAAEHGEKQEWEVWAEAQEVAEVDEGDAPGIKEPDQDNDY